MKLTDKFTDGRTLFAFELLPPLKGQNIESIYSAIDTLREFSPSYINVTYHREEIKLVEREGGLLERRVVRKRPGTVGISAAIQARYSIDVVPHLICGGFSADETEDALIEMNFLGIDNVLALRGDNMRGEHTFRPHEGGHCHASELVSQIASMNRGEYLSGEVEHCAPTDFCIGVAGYPEKHAESPNVKSDIARLKEKVDAGANYIVTQMFFDNSRFFSFVDECRAAGIEVPVIPGLKPFSTKAQLSLLPQVFGVNIPEELASAVDKAPDNAHVRNIGIEWAVGQCRELIKAGVPALHFYSMGRPDNIASIASRVF
ncbi:MAG: methylenetetrahydrofolate reductase [NAD(P)H] [Flavobacteriales bacterium]|nr:MAG: methylenetetrahydrofolate reductase [NAD(P)H] [Flavobacteriales bacterium]